MNVRLLRRIQKAILAEPRRFDMDWWISRNVDGVDAPPCGTTACIAGHAVLIHHGFNTRRFPLAHLAEHAAVKLLDLTVGQSDRLFYKQNWPWRFGVKLYTVKTAKARAKVAVARIEAFIKSGGEE